MAIVGEIHTDAFDATQDLLLVPVPGLTDRLPDGGFAGEVMRRSKLAVAAFKYAPMDPGEVRIRPTGMSNTSYRFALAAIHHDRVGWLGSDYLLKKSLEEIENRFGSDSTLATAGVPGEGWSGIKGDAHIPLIRAALENSRLAITIYRREAVGDREPRDDIDPLPQDMLALSAPR